MEQGEVNVSSIEKLNIARQLLSEAKNLDDVLHIRDIAEAARVYAQAAKLGLENQNEAAEVKIRAERKAGEMLAQMPKQNGGDAMRARYQDVTEDIPPTLADLGIEKMQSSRWQAIANLPEDIFEEHITETKADGKELTTAGLIRVAKVDEIQNKPHVSYNSGENEWYTPSKFIESARLVMGSIDTDPASSCLANKTVKAKRYFTEETNGLIQKWNGNVWMNPPYSQPLITEFSNRLAEKYNEGEFEQACILVNNATETQFYQLLMRCCSAICFVRGRIKFIDMNGIASGAPLQGQTIIYYGNNIKEFASEFSQYGQVLYA